MSIIYEWGIPLLAVTDSEGGRTKLIDSRLANMIGFAKDDFLFAGQHGYQHPDGDDPIFGWSPEEIEAWRKAHKGDNSPEANRMRGKLNQVEKFRRRRHRRGNDTRVSIIGALVGVAADGLAALPSDENLRRFGKGCTYVGVGAAAGAGVAYIAPLRLVAASPVLAKLAALLEAAQ